jgi:hypothetical protein
LKRKGTFGHYREAGGEKVQASGENRDFFATGKRGKGSPVVLGFRLILGNRPIPTQILDNERDTGRDLRRLSEVQVRN